MTVQEDIKTKSTSELEISQDGLSIRGISKCYFGIPVLQDININIEPGEVVALLGENGAGKSTLSGIIAGVIQPEPEGKMYWQGKLYEPESPGDAHAAGIGLIHQELRLLPDLSIAENVFVGKLPEKNGVVDRKKMNELAGEQLRRLGLDVSPTQKVSTLRVAAQQQVEIAKALTLNAKLIILDEPTAALGGEETEKLFEQIEKLKKDGMSFIYISHRLEEISRIADRIVVLRDGMQIAVHETAQVDMNIVISEMVGRSVDRLFPEPCIEHGDVVLKVDNLSAPDQSFQDISFEVHAGEIFGISGIVGAGRTELIRAICQVDPIESGEVTLNGKSLIGIGPRNAIKEGVVLIPEDRKHDGLIIDHTIAENMSYGNFDVFGNKGWVTPKKKTEFSKRHSERMNVKGLPHHKVSSLSGGNQQKVVIAKWISRNPKVFVLDEPTRGIDVGARSAIYDVIAGLAKKGMAVVIVSSDLEEILGLSHRIMVLARGRNQGILSREEATSIKVMALATK